MFSDISNIEQSIPSFSSDNPMEPTIYTSIHVEDNGSSTSDDSGDKFNEHIMIKVNSDIPLRHDIIQEEPLLKTYTDNHFDTQIKRDLENLQLQEDPFFQQEFSNYRSNSPVLSVLDSNNHSNNNSDSDDDNRDHYTTRNNRRSNKSKYSKLDTNDIKNYVKKYYATSNGDDFTNELDILTTFVRGQRNLYSQCKLITLHKLYLLVFPALIIAAGITSISPFIECDSQINSNIITGLNGLVTLFISMVGFLNLESLHEKFLILTSLFENIETNLELTSTKFMMLKKESDISDLIINKFNEVEDKLSEYKLITQITILPEMKLLFPIISHINIFSFIKKTELMKKGLIEKLRDVKNEISYIKYKFEQRQQIHKIKSAVNTDALNPSPQEQYDYKKESIRLNTLFKLKTSFTNEIIELQNAYSIMDNIFYREIAQAEKKQNKWWFCLFCFYFYRSYDNKEYMKDLLQHLSPNLKELIIHY